MSSKIERWFSFLDEQIKIKQMGEHKEFVRAFWKEWFEREEKLDSEHMCMHNHSEPHQWKLLRSIEKRVSIQVCMKCLTIKE